MLQPLDDHAKNITQVRPPARPPWGGPGVLAAAPAGELLADGELIGRAQVAVRT